jgi:hypothetical protein
MVGLRSLDLRADSCEKRCNIINNFSTISCFSYLKLEFGPVFFSQSGTFSSFENIILFLVIYFICNRI